MAMPSHYGEHRSDDREVAVNFRLRREARERISREARDLGLTRQQLFELRMLGEIQPNNGPGRPRKSASAGQEELPVTA